MFRDFVKRKAIDLSLTGTVKNISDGSVVVVAEGDEGNLKKLIIFLWKGPWISRMIAHVDNVEERWDEPTGEFPDFRILY